MGYLLLQSGSRSMSQQLGRVVAGGLVCVNGGTAGLFFMDKRIAEANGPKEKRVEQKSSVWRVSENALCCTALVGGWPAGYISMQIFKHKSSKQSFQQKYGMATGMNILCLTALHPGVRAAISG